MVNGSNIRRFGPSVLFTAYLCLLSYLLFWSPGFNREAGRVAYNIVPFRTILNYLMHIHKISSRIWVTNLLGNVAAFMPFGFLAALVFPKLRRGGKILLLTIGASLAAEAAQFLFTVGSFDVDDIILNAIGGFLGLVILRILLPWTGFYHKSP